MPNFTIPFMYRSQALKRHRVVCAVSEPLLVTGGARGDIVVWTSATVPAVVMYPNLSDVPGAVVLLLLIRMPFLQILVC